MSMMSRFRFVLLVTCLVASLALSDASSRTAWLSGGHVTPEQVALHAQYEALGMHDHHAHDHADAADAGVAGSLSAVATPPTTLMLGVAFPAGRVDSAVTAQSRSGAAGMLVPPASFGTRVPLAVLAPQQIAHTRLDPPPRRAA